MLHYDVEHVSALEPKKETLWKRVEGASFMTVNEKRAAIGLPAVEGGDRI